MNEQLPLEFVHRVAVALGVPFYLAADTISHAWPIPNCEIIAEFGGRFVWQLPPIEGETLAKLEQALHHLRGG